MLFKVDLNFFNVMIVGKVIGVCVMCVQECGDVDFDGILDFKDVMMINDIILVFGQYQVCIYWVVDINGDGNVNVNDVFLFLVVININKLFVCVQ